MISLAQMHWQILGASPKNRTLKLSRVPSLVDEKLLQGTCHGKTRVALKVYF
jgi:hypothetical protein